MFLSKLFDANAREIERLRRSVVGINELEPHAQKLKDADFPRETQKLKEKINGDPALLTPELPWAYALVREAAQRSLGLRHFDEQLIAGIALHEGKIAEQKTGEGKTLSATTSLYLNALVGKGVHLVTVNDYLARRDAGWNGKLFHFLGLTTSAIISEHSFIYDPSYKDTATTDWRLQNLREITRAEAYQADITYGINSEYGFDYLRDNMVSNSRERVQREYFYAIVDEVDSVLIDEARTPHIISAPYDDDVSRYYDYARVVARLMPETDYIIDEKMRTAHVSERGLEKIEKMLGSQNIYETNYDALFHIEAALKARTLFSKDKDYIVRGTEIVIVDEFTGRLLEGRRFSEGIHQAIEAKEGVPIKQESKTLATVSLQNYFRMYKKLAGMTGTAATEAEELYKIYKVSVVVIPTHRPTVRADHPDYIYKTQRGKFTALVSEIETEHKKGRPILVGTTNIEKNEVVSSLLKKKGIPHQVLNAKNHEKEAEIISNAGKIGAVTIATNMAGRGVDIILGGAPPNPEGITDAAYKKALATWRSEHDEVVERGGLYVMGTERHESRRIDNQLRGRSGRQGDPGDTRFFISLEDDMLRIFGGEQIGKMMSFFNFPENQPIEHSLVSRSISQAQVKVEGFHFDSRKHLLEFDDVLNKQRDIVYSRRREVLETAEKDPLQLRDIVLRSLNASIDEAMEDVAAFATELFTISTEDQEALRELSPTDARKAIVDMVEKTLDTRAREYSPEVFYDVVKVMYLSTLDQYYTEHLTAIDNIREGINLRGYAQLDPLVEYKKEAFKIFNDMLEGVRNDFIRRVLHVQIQLTQAKEKELPKEDIKQKKIKEKLGRNDPCWCGSGKKWKKCHYPALS